MKSVSVAALATLIALAALCNSADAKELNTKFLFRPRPWLWIPLPLPIPPPAEGGQCSVPMRFGCSACGATPGPECNGDKTKRIDCFDLAIPCTPDCKNNCEPKCDANCDW